MGTPLMDAVNAYVAKDSARFHMPGHKGAAIPPVGGASQYDITEVAGADSLYEASGPIAAVEAAYAGLYGSAGTLLCAGGSTLCIQTMLALGAAPGSKILCGRGVHTAAINAMALLDLNPEWICPDLDPATGLALAITPHQVAAALAAHPDTAAVYLTSPNYYGVLCDIAGIATLCRRHAVPLLVDNAHGAHLKFLPRSLHPMDAGADMCCDSLHKTLPVLTGGAALHIGNAAYLADAKRKMSLFGSTSPSYLILLSADGALPYLRDSIRADLVRVADQVAELSVLAADRGFLLPGGALDPTRLTLGFAALGFTADAFRDHLTLYNIEPEFCGDSFCVFLISGQNRPEDFARLRRAIAGAPKAPPLPRVADALPRPERALPLRRAMFARSSEIPVDEAVGRVSGAMVAPCPPGIPLVVAGEIFDSFTCSALKKYGILSVHVLELE